MTDKYLKKKGTKKNKGKIIYTKGQTFSSSRIINDNLSMVFNEQQSNFLKRLGKNIVLKITSSISWFRKIKVLIIGETIIDDMFSVKQSENLEKNQC